MRKIVSLMRRLLHGLAVIFLCFSPAAHAQIPLEPDVFTTVMMHALSEQADPSAKLSQPEPLLIRVEVGGRTLDARLDSLHRNCVSQVGFCRDAVKRYIASWLEFVKGAPEKPNAAQLRVLLRDADYVEQLTTSHSRAGAAAPLAKQYLGELWMVLAIAGETVNWIASEKTLALLGLDAAAAFEIALKHTRQAIPRLPHVARPLQGPFSISIGEYDSTRMLLHSDWAAVAPAHKGELLASVPATDVIIFGSSATPEDAAQLKDLASRVMRNASSPLSTDVYRWRGNRWELIPEAGLRAGSPDQERTRLNYVITDPRTGGQLTGNNNRLEATDSGLATPAELRSARPPL